MFCVRPCNIVSHGPSSTNKHTIIIELMLQPPVCVHDIDGLEQQSIIVEYAYVDYRQVIVQVHDVHYARVTSPCWT